MYACTNSAQISVLMCVYIYTYIHINRLVSSSAWPSNPAAMKRPSIPTSYVHTYIHTYIHTYPNKRTHRHKQIHMHIYRLVSSSAWPSSAAAKKRPSIPTYIHKQISAYIHTKTHAYIQARELIRVAFTYIQTYIHTYIHTYIQARELIRVALQGCGQEEAFNPCVICTYIHTYIHK